MLICYCSQSCQKENSQQHKYICNIFPAVNGKSVVVRKLESLQKKSTAAPFRKGKRTMVNTKIRDALQIEAKYVLLESNFSKIIDFQDNI